MKPGLALVYLYLLKIERGYQSSQSLISHELQGNGGKRHMAKLRGKTFIVLLYSIFHIILYDKKPLIRKCPLLGYFFGLKTQNLIRFKSNIIYRIFLSHELELILIELYSHLASVTTFCSHLVDLRLSNVCTLLSLFQLMLDLSALGQMSIGLFLLK